MASRLKQGAAQGAAQVRLGIQRPSKLRGVTVHKVETPLGLTLAYQQDGSTCLQIRGPMKGAAQVYNDAAPSYMKIHPGDFIESVNGVAGSAKELLEEIRKSSTVDLVLLR